MAHFLLRLFVKNADQTSDPKVRAAVGTLSGIVGILCNFFLFLGKVIIGTLSGSVSITADAMNNLSDAASSIVTLVGFKLAEQPADAEHVRDERGAGRRIEGDRRCAVPWRRAGDRRPHRGLKCGMRCAATGNTGHCRRRRPVRIKKRNTGAGGGALLLARGLSARSPQNRRFCRAAVSLRAQGRLSAAGR